MGKSILYALCLTFVFSVSCLQDSREGVGPSGAGATSAESTAPPPWLESAVEKLEGELVAEYGESQRSRAERGLKQMSDFWRESDGDQKVFEEFVGRNFAGDQASLDTMFGRFERLLEKAIGHMYEISREFRQQTDLDAGPVESYDEVFAAHDPSAHLIDDFFNNKLAFVVLLNFPLTTLDERLSAGNSWTRRQWAETRMAEYFSKRIPAEVNLAISKAAAETDQYISEYNIWMYHLIDEQDRRLFPPQMRLLSHWNLRDEIKASYGDSQNGFAKQRMIEKVMERIVTQTIPSSVIDNPQLDWNPFTNEVKPATEHDSDFSPKRSEEMDGPEPNTRYRHLLEAFRASKLADPYSPNAPTLMARRFDEDRQIPEERVQEMFEQVLASPLVPRIAELIQKRLGRPLEPFDIWYNGFRAKSKYPAAELDAIIARRYPNAEAFETDMPALLRGLGFPSDRAAFAAANIVVEPARGSGHAMGAGMRQARARLRTRIGEGGMNYKGYNIAIHELGHNVEQTFSLNAIDYYSLNGVPNTAFTEALAFVFQGHDLELLGLESPDEEAEALKALNTFWSTYEICGVSLVDMRVWHWMYEHPEAEPEDLRNAVLQISKDVWNEFYAPVFGKRDAVLLGIYSHMIHSFLYLPDYPLGHIIAFQLEEHMKKAGRVGPEFERVARQGALSPDLWMKGAVGAPVGTEALIAATESALNRIN
jgi:hypothetical protein